MTFLQVAAPSQQISVRHSESLEHDARHLSSTKIDVIGYDTLPTDAPFQTRHDDGLTLPKIYRDPVHRRPMRDESEEWLRNHHSVSPCGKLLMKEVFLPLPLFPRHTEGYTNEHGGRSF